MLTTFDLQAKNLPSDPQVGAITDGFSRRVALGMQFALCLRWLAIRQRHKTMSPRERVDMTMTDAVDLIADIRAHLPNTENSSISSLGRFFGLMTVREAVSGPSIHDLPTILRQAEVGALFVWVSARGFPHPMAAYRSVGLLGELGPDRLSLYTADYGEFEPIKINMIRTLPEDAIQAVEQDQIQILDENQETKDIRQYQPKPFVGCKVVLMQLIEQDH